MERQRRRGKGALNALGEFLGGVIIIALGAGLVYVLLGSAWFNDPIGWGPALFAESDPSPSSSPPNRVQPVYQRPDAEPDPIPEPDAPLLWECEWDPTMNNDWHDDVVCRRGWDAMRPNLLPNDRFVTQEEILLGRSGV